MNKKYLALILIIFAISFLNAEIFNFDKVIRNEKGKKAYKDNDTEKAKENFGANALKYPTEGEMHFNLGNAQYKNGKLEEAENSYNLSLRDQKFPHSSKALQNLGNIKFDQKNYPEAIKYFRNSLIKDHTNKEARHNYEVTSRLLQKQQQQKQQNKDQNKNDENDDKKEQQKDEQKENDQQDKQQEQQKKQDEKSENEKQEQQELKKREDMKKEDAEKVLKALLQKEKEEMEKKKKQTNPNEVKSGKYW